MKKLSAVLLVILMFSLSLTGCGGSKQGTASSDTGKTDGQANKVYVGFIGPLTGPSAYIGVDSLHGAQIAALEINAQGGFEVNGKKYELEIAQYDDEMNAAKSVAGLQKLKDQYNIKLAINNLSGTIMALLQKNEETGVLLTGFFKVVDATDKGNKLVLRFQNTTNDEAALLAKGAKEVIGAKTYAIFADSTDYGKGVVKVWQEQFEKLGVKQVALEWANQTKENDFRPQLTKIKAANPDVVMCANYDEASAAGFLQSKELGMKVPWVFTTGMQQKGVDMIGKDKIEGNYMPMNFEKQTPTPPGTQHYRDLFAQKSKELGWKEPGGSYGANVYEQVWAMIYGMQKAGTVNDAAKIKEGIIKSVPVPEEHRSGGQEGFEATGNGIISQTFTVFRNGVLGKP